MQKMTHNFSKVYAVATGVFSVLFLLFCIYAIVASLLGQMWQLTLMSLLMVLFGITYGMLSFNRLLGAFGNTKNAIVTKLAKRLSIISFVYLTAISIYLYFVEKYPGSLKLVIFSLVILAPTTFDFFYKQIRARQ